MEFKRFGDHYLVRIDRGEEVLSSLAAFCGSEDIRLGSISGLGAADHAVLGVYSGEEQRYYKKELNEPLEISGLTGNISRMDGKIYLHVHATVCDEETRAYGGHLSECRISGTCELCVTRLDGEAGRKYDPATGLNLYSL